MYYEKYTVQLTVFSYNSLLNIKYYNIAEYKQNSHYVN